MRCMSRVRVVEGRWLSKARQMRGDEVLRYGTCEIVVAAQFTSSCVQGGKSWW